MTVIIANDTPDAIRGMLKRWFIEPRPNVFVGTINRRTREKTLDYIKRNAAGLGMLMISSDNNCQQFKIESYGETNRRETIISGLWLVAEQWRNFSPCCRRFSPPAWGWSELGTVAFFYRCVFPTRVGMVRNGRLLTRL